MAIACPPKMPWTTFPRTNVGAASRVSGAAFSSETRGSTTGATYSPTADFLEPNQQSRGRREAVLIIAARSVLEGVDFTLHEGDTLFFDGRTKHRLKNIGSGDALLLAFYLF